MNEEKRRLELEPVDLQDHQYAGGTPKAKKPMASLAHTGGKAPAPRSVARKTLFDRWRGDTSLGLLTQRFTELLSRTSDGVLDLNEVAEQLGTPKRRIYDVTNVLEGIDLIQKKSKNLIEWMGGQVNPPKEQVMNPLIEEETRLDELIQSCTRQIHHFFEDQHTRRFAYLTYEDVQEIPSWTEQTVIVIKAPAETKLEVPHPEESLQVHLSSTQGPIEVFLCHDDPVPMEATDSSGADGCSLNPSANGNGSATPPPYSSFVQVSPKDDSNCSSGTKSVSDLLSEPLLHTLQPSVSPPPAACESVRPPSEEQQSFVSLTPPLAFSLEGDEYLLSLPEDHGITDLFSSFDLGHLPL